MPSPGSKLTPRLVALAGGAIVAAAPAFAHHPMGGATPATFADGLLSGVGHPVIGLDHLAALIGVGLLAARFGGWGVFALPWAWLAAMGVGVGAHLAGVELPFAEVCVALGVIAVGLAAALRPMLSLGPAGLLFALVGFAHGYALGEAVAGAEATPVVAYLIGLVAIQATIATGVAVLTRRLWALGSERTPPAAPPALRFAGLALAVAGAAALTVGLPSLA